MLFHRRDAEVAEKGIWAGRVWGTGLLRPLLSARVRARGRRCPRPHGLWEAWLGKGIGEWSFGADWEGASGVVGASGDRDCAAGAGARSECGADFLGSADCAVAGGGVGVRCGSPPGWGERGRALDRREKEGDPRESGAGNAESGFGPGAEWS